MLFHFYKNEKSVFLLAFLFAGIFLLALIFPTFHAGASTIDDLKAKISERNSLIQQLEQEIETYKAEVEKTQNQSKTLSNTLKTLDLSKKKLLADINLTKQKIGTVNLQIDSLTLQISDAENTIDGDIRIISSSLSLVRKSQDRNIMENLLAGNSVSQILNETTEQATLQKSVKDRIFQIKEKKSELLNLKSDTESEKKKLQNLNSDLLGQTKAVESTAKEKQDLLSATKSKEASYKKLLADREARKNSFEAEVSAYESALKQAIDPNSIPASGAGILKWPLDKIVITQKFGITAFSLKNPDIYTSAGHSGVDFAATVGTPVKATLNGIIAGTGNTDITPSCDGASFGNWIMIEHPNGLSTLYAHLSVTLAKTGSAVTKGQTIALSGGTAGVNGSGASTGPHLHFGVYATEGIQIKKNDVGTSCRNVVLPVLIKKGARLNPLLYL
ncbi:MAG: peptidoglycan DD-metalloendopeptidase family protein [bacterium]